MLNKHIWERIWIFLEGDLVVLLQEIRIETREQGVPPLIRLRRTSSIPREAGLGAPSRIGLHPLGMKHLV
jgi:hypothetical protein